MVASATSHAVRRQAARESERVLPDAADGVGRHQHASRRAEGGVIRASTSAFMKPSGRSRVIASASPSCSSGKRVGVERLRVQACPRATASTAAAIPRGIWRVALVRIDHVQAAPVPELHIDLARSVLVIAGDDQPPALAREFGGEIERPLRAHGFDHHVAKRARR